MPKTIVWSPKKILELGNMWLPATLHTAVKLGIFDAIGDRSATLVAVMQKTKTSQHGTEPLLNALAAAGLLIKKNNQYPPGSVRHHWQSHSSSRDKPKPGTTHGLLSGHERHRSARGPTPCQKTQFQGNADTP